MILRTRKSLLYLTTFNNQLFSKAAPLKRSVDSRQIIRQAKAEAAQVFTGLDEDFSQFE